MNYWVALVLLCTAAAPLIQDQSNPSCPTIYQRFSENHTFCLQPNPRCNILISSPAKTEKDFILDLHNKARSRMANGMISRFPKAADMIQMEWDDELAEIAQKLTLRCQRTHDCHSCRQTKNFVPGQNVFTWKSSVIDLPPTPNWTTIVRVWFDEYSNFDTDKLTSFESREDEKKTGHFTQIAWSKSWKIGCGYTTFAVGYDFYQLSACNYGPTGNVLNGTVYKEGEPCSKCPTNSCCGENCKTKRRTYPGLCQITDSKAPSYPREENYVYLCDFTDMSKCHMKSLYGKKPWTITRTLSGTYTGVLLEAGELSGFNITGDISTDSETGMCITTIYRKSANLARQRASSTAKQNLKLQDFGYTYEHELFNDTVQFMPQKILLKGVKNFTYSLTFSVGEGEAPQFMDVKEISVTEGECP